MRVLTDNPIQSKREDKFGFCQYAQYLADQITKTENLPFCVAVFGDWGTGKTSLLNMIQEEVLGVEGIKTLWFNPWKYDKKEDLWHAFIQSILYHIAETDKDNALKEKVKDIAKTLVWLLLRRGLTQLTSSILSETSIDKMKEALAKQDEIHYRHVNRFEDDFKEVVARFTQGGRLVMFIDDLDRCLPENAVTILESMKLFMGGASCVFVIAMDHNVVEQGFTARFGRHLRVSGKDYLDKMVQHAFFLPPVPFDKLKNALIASGALRMESRTWKLIELGLGGNPRRTKRFLNSFTSLQHLVDRGWGSYDPRKLPKAIRKLRPEDRDFLLAKLLIFQMTYPRFYSHIKLYPADWEFIGKRLVNTSRSECEKAFGENPEVRQFWDDARFQLFMAESRPRRGTRFLAAPGDKVLPHLLSAVAMVVPPERTTASNDDL